MKRLILILLTLCLPAFAESLQSGLAVGEKAPAHHPQHVTGPDAGTDTCPVWKYRDRPACQVFLNGESDANTRSLVKILSAAANDHKNAEFKAFVLFVQDTPEHLKALNKAEKADNVALCLLKGKDDEALGLYKVSPAAKSTVLIYKDREITARFVDYDARKDGEKLKQAIAATCK